MSAPRLPLFDVVVKKASLVTPGVKRILLDASAIKHVVRGVPTEWLKVVVPGRDGQQASVARAYTIRSFDRETGALALDFVLHGDSGAVSAWAQRAGEGDTFAITPPHPRSVYPVDATPRPYLLFGDETALPAVATILRALPPGASAHAVLEVEDAAEEQSFAIPPGVSATLRWVHRSGDAASTLARVVEEIALPEGDVAVWAAGEAVAVRAVRDHFRRAGVARIHATGYWKKGAADFRDEDA